jgi:hypothetical protein
MNLITIDNLLKNPDQYLSEVNKYGFQDISDGKNTFKNIQPRDIYDDFSKEVLSLFPEHKITFNFIRKSLLNQDEPNFIHTDEMMGDITCILYLNKDAPKEDGTTIYDKDNNPLVTIYSKFNRMISFNSDASHSRNIFENFGQEEDSRLIQVIFLRKK